MPSPIPEITPARWNHKDYIWSLKPLLRSIRLCEALGQLCIVSAMVSLLSGGRYNYLVGMLCLMVIPLAGVILFLPTWRKKFPI